MRRFQELWWRELQQFAFDLVDRLPGASFMRLATRNACVHRQRGLAEGPRSAPRSPSCDDAGSASSAARSWHLTAMALDQLSCSGDCVFGLVAKESDGLDVLGKLRLAE